MLLTDDLLSYYKLDETSGSVFTDATTTENGSCWGTYDFNVSAVINTGWGASGGAGLGQFGAKNGMEGQGAISVSVWVYADSWIFTNWPLIFGNSFVTSNDGAFRLMVHADGSTYSRKLGFRVRNTSDTDAEAKTNSILSATTWYHIVGTYDGSTVRLYINGVVQSATASLTGNTDSTGNNCQVFYGRNIAGEKFSGDIDEVGFWTRALTQTEITSLYNNGDGLAYPFGLPTVKMNVSDIWKDIMSAKINIGDVWKDIYSIKINVGDTWKDVF